MNPDSSGRMWEFMKDGEVFGPYAVDGIKRAILSDQVVRSTRVREVGTTEWKRAGSVRAIYPSKKRLRRSRSKFHGAMFYSGVVAGFLAIAWSLYHLPFGWVLLLTFAYSLCLLPFAGHANDTATVGVIGMIGCTVISAAAGGVFLAYNPPPSRTQLPDRQVTRWSVYQDTGKVVPGSRTQEYVYDNKRVTGEDARGVIFLAMGLAYCCTLGGFAMAMVGFLSEDGVIDIS